MSDSQHEPIDQPDTTTVRPTASVDSHSWVGELDRFDRLFEAGFATDESVFAAIDRVEQAVTPPAAVDASFQRIAQQYCEMLKPEAVEVFAPLYYSALRAGFSAAEAVLSVRGVAVSDVEQAAFDDRFAAITRAWTGLDPWSALSDLGYYVLDDLMPSLHDHVADVMRAAVPSAELPEGWEMVPPLRQPLDRAINAVMVGAAAALAAGGVDAL